MYFVCTRFLNQTIGLQDSVLRQTQHIPSVMLRNTCKAIFTSIEFVVEELRKVIDQEVRSGFFTHHPMLAIIRHCRIGEEVVLFGHVEGCLFVIGTKLPLGNLDGIGHILTRMGNAKLANGI